MTISRKIILSLGLIAALLLSGFFYDFFWTKQEKEKYLSFPRIHNEQIINSVVLSRVKFNSFYRGNYLVKMNNNKTYLVGDTLKFMIEKGTLITRKKGEKMFTIINGNKKEHYVNKDYY